MATLRLGLLGSGIGHSRSPALHGAARAGLGHDGTYELLDTADESQALAAVERLRAGGLDGLNVTTPWKAWAAVQCARGLDGDGRPQAGPPDRPVNTLAMRDGQLCGGSTDGPGLCDALQAAGVVLAGARVVLLGAGGAAAAIAPDLIAAGAATVRIVNRDDGKATRLARQLSAAGGAVVEALPWGHATPLAAADLVVQASRFGHGLVPPFDLAADPGLDWLPWTTWASGGAVLVDLVYGPSPTPWQALALAAGVPADARLQGATQAGPARGVLLGAGEAMLAAQAARCWRLWTGDAVDWRALLAAAGVRRGG